MGNKSANNDAGASRRFMYSPVWRLLAFVLPLAIFFFAYRTLHALQTGDLIDQAYLAVAFVCAFVAVGPHLFIAAVLSGSFRVGPEGVTRSWFGFRRTLTWPKILECRDFLNQIQVIPAREADTIYVQFYNNLVRPVTFHKMLIRYAREYETNLMLRPTTRRFLPIRWRSLVLFGLIIGTGAVLVAARGSRKPIQEAIMLIGFIIGCGSTTVSVALWMTVSKSHKRIRAQGLMFSSLYMLMLLLPLLVLGAREATNHSAKLVFYTFAYLFGFFSGSGLLGLFYPNREISPIDHATEVLGNQG